MLARLLTVAILSVGGGARVEAGAEALGPCKVGLADGRCGTIEVPERRDRTGGRKLELFVAVVPASGEDRQDDPILVLEGGPGASVLHFAGLHVQTFATALERRDLVLVDQRGTGRSAPLDCDLMSGFRALPSAESARRCREVLSGDADPARYTTEDAVADLADVLDELGYETVNLFGVSNGTRTALRFVHRHPDRVRTLTLLAPYPTTRNVFVDGGATLDHSLEAMVAACSGDTNCAAQYPAFSEMIERVAGTHGASAGWPLFSSGVRMMLFFPLQASRLPQLLDMVDRAGRIPEPTAGPQDELLAGWISQGAMLSILCAEDAARTTLAEVREHSADTFLGPGWAESMLASCAEWPTRPLPPDFAEPVTSEVPALLLVGALDPAMPPAWAHETAATLPNARVVEVPEGQHSFIGMTGVGCVLGLMQSFIEAGSAAALDDGCAAAMRRPPFSPPVR